MEKNLIHHRAPAVARGTGAGFVLSLLAMPAMMLTAAAGCGKGGDAQNGDPSKGGGSKQVPGADEGKTLSEARKGFVTKLRSRTTSGDPVEPPPADVFRLVKYESPAGSMSAYLTPDPRDGRKHPAIIWITGGDCNSIGEVWDDAPAADDQTAAAYRKAGIVMMFPSLRGGNTNPGVREGFFGEVDDVLAAADHLAKLPYVDPTRIHLGGHSTGGTLVLLVAAASDRFRSVISFGPTADIEGYGDDYTYHDRSIPREAELRSPGRWLGVIKSRTFVIEGGYGNARDLLVMQRRNGNPAVRFVLVQRADHFNVLAPVNRLLAERIVNDTGPTCGIELTGEEAVAAMRR